MAFINKPVRTDEPYRWSQRLYEHLAAHKLLFRKKTNLHHWANHFKRLQTKEADKIIDSTLNWWIAHFKDKGTPQIFSAKGFVLTFDRIKAAIKRAGNDLPTKISDDARLILSRCEDGHYWPSKEQGGSEREDEIDFIQACLDEYTKIYNFWKEMAARPKKTLHVEIAQQIFDSMNYPIEFVEGWVNDIHERAWSYFNWKGSWHGDFRKCICVFTHPLMQENLEEAVYSYMGDDAQILEEMKGMFSC